MTINLSAAELTHVVTAVPGVRGIEPPTWGDEVYLDWPENQPTPLTR